jgi:putative ABC transport system ATP-binding protein
MITISNLSKSFGDKVLFENYSASIQTGEFVSFTGVSGCGKTTLLNMIGSIEKADGGKIEIDGVDVGLSKNRMRLFREVYGFLFQNFALVENKTVEENLSLILPQYASGVTMEDALEQVGLTGYQNTKVYKLSGGEQQRVSLARLILKKCRLILADEPTGSLDKGNASRVMEILKYLNQSSKTVILVTHDEEIVRYGSRVIHIGG